MAKFKKYERGGDIAVLISGGHGAGWSTWGEPSDALAMDRDLVEALLTGGAEAVVKVASKKYPGAYQGGIESLRVEWVPKGKRFEINEYDGNESLRIFDDKDGWVA